MGKNKVKAQKLVTEALEENAQQTREIVGKVCQDPEMVADLWQRLDANENDITSLAEIENFVRGLAADRSNPPKYHGFFVGLYNKKPLLRAYYYTNGGVADHLRQSDFVALLRNIYFYNKLWEHFEKIDVDNDKRIDLKEFEYGAKQLGFKLSKKDLEDSFNKIDENGGGIILFDEFCAWCIQLLGLDDDNIVKEFPVLPAAVPATAIEGA